MSRGAPTGRCQLCGSVGKLSFEHVPPESAFNNRPVFLGDIKKMLDAKTVLPLRGGKQCQRGSGAYTLCERCNNNTGGWYGSAYVEWAVQAAYNLSRASGARTIDATYSIYPSRVLKQVLCMFFSANSNGLGQFHDAAKAVVLDKYARGLPDGLGVLAFITRSWLLRQAGFTGQLDIRNGQGYYFSEVAHPPFGFVMTWNCPKPDERLTDIRYFSTFDYDHLVRLSLRLYVLEVNTWAPCDYRTLPEIEEDIRDGQGQRADLPGHD